MPKPTPAGTIYIGIDPGMSGGICALLHGRPAGLHPMPRTERGIVDVLRGVRGSGGLLPVQCAIEKVHSMPKQGVSSTFKFGQNYGFLRGCLVAYEIPFVEVAPQKWQKACNVPGRKKEETKSQWKARLQQVAENLFPGVKLTQATADALLIAFYCQMLHVKGQAEW